MADKHSFIDFKQLTKRESPNDYLVCPKGYCKAADMLSPTYNVPAHQLQTSWQTMIDKQPRTCLVKKDAALQQFIYEQRSFLFRFPDYITVQFVPMSNDQSSLMIYSASKYGYSDFGVNEKRVTRWLADLKQIISADNKE